MCLLKRTIRPEDNRPQMARLLRGLYDRSQTTFTLADAEEITRLRPALASSLLHKAAKRGVVSRLSAVSLFWFRRNWGAPQRYAGNPYLVARGLAAIRLLHLPRFGDGDFIAWSLSRSWRFSLPARNASRTGRCRAPSFDLFSSRPGISFRHDQTLGHQTGVGDISDPERP